MAGQHPFADAHPLWSQGNARFMSTGIGAAAMTKLEALFECPSDDELKEQAEIASHDFYMTRRARELAVAMSARQAVGSHANYGVNLTFREMEVIALLGSGLSIKSVARVLSLSHATAKWYSKEIYDKLGAKGREEALRKLRTAGLMA